MLGATPTLSAQPLLRCPEEPAERSWIRGGGGSWKASGGMTSCEHATVCMGVLLFSSPKLELRRMDLNRPYTLTIAAGEDAGPPTHLYAFRYNLVGSPTWTFLR